MKLAVDVCIGKRGVKILRDAGHDVVVEAQHAERDEDWFARAVAAGAEAVIAADSDLASLCYDHGGVMFIRAAAGRNGRGNAARAVARLARIAQDQARPFPVERPPP